MKADVLEELTTYIRQVQAEYIVSSADLFLLFLKGKDLRIYDLFFLLWSDGDLDSKGADLISTLLAEGVELIAPSYERTLIDE